MINSKQWPGLLKPYNAAEAISVAEAARRAGVSREKIRLWVLHFSIGRKLADGQYRVSAVALQLLLDDNKDGLRRYLTGDRLSADVCSTFDACGIPIVGKRSCATGAV